MSNLRPYEIILILLVILLLFGAKRLPDAARGLGRSLRIFKAETKGLRDDDEPAETGYSDTAGPRYDESGRRHADGEAGRTPRPIEPRPIEPRPVGSFPAETQATEARGVDRPVDRGAPDVSPAREQPDRSER